MIEKTRRIKTIWAIILLGIMIMFISNMALVSSAPPSNTPVAQTSSSTGLEIAYPKYSVVKQNTSFDLHFHVINATSKITNNTASCYLHLYGINGEHTTQANTSFNNNGLEFQQYVLGNNFTDLGTHTYIIQCLTSTQTGFASGTFEVTKSGLSTGGDNIIILFIIITIILFFGLVYLTFYSLGHLVSLDFDLKDVAFNWGILFATYITLFFEQLYLGNVALEGLYNTVITIMIWTNGIIPILAFVLSITVGTLIKNKKEKGEYGNGD